MEARTVGSLLSRDLAKAKMIPNQLAKASGVHRQRIADYMNKDRCPDDENLQKMLKVIPRLTFGQKEQYWKAQQKQKLSSSTNRKRVGTQSKTNAGSKRISKYYESRIDFGVTTIKYDGKAEPYKQGNKNVDKLSAKEQIAEIALLDESLRSDMGELAKHKASLEGVEIKEGDINILSKCTISLIPIEKKGLPSLQWRMTVDNLDKGKQPCNPTFFVEGKSVSESEMTKKIREVTNRDIRLDLTDVYCFIYLELKNFLRIKRSQQEQEEGCFQIPLELATSLITTFSDLKPFLLGKKEISKNSRLIKGTAASMQHSLDGLLEYYFLEESRILSATWLSKYFEAHVNQYLK